MKKILIVEDEAIIALHLRRMLEKLGYEGLGNCDSGKAAIAKSAEFRPDLILMDIILAGKMDGIQAAEYIKEKFNIPVIYITAQPRKFILKRDKDLPPFGSISKPVDINELQNAIESIIS